MFNFNPKWFFLIAFVDLLVALFFMFTGSGVIAALAAVAGLAGMSASLAVISVNSPFMRRRMSRDD